MRPIPNLQDNYSNYLCIPNATVFEQGNSAYNDIFNGNLKGSFKVALVHQVYLIKSDYIDQLSYSDETEDWEYIIFSRNACKNQVDQYICNVREFGTFIHHHNAFGVTKEQEKDLFERILQKQ